jgi:hypothetical protein
MTKTIRKIAHKIELPGLSILLPTPGVIRVQREGNVRRDEVSNVTYRKPRIKRPSRQSLVFFSALGLRQSWIGMAKMIKSRTAVLTAWATKTCMNGRGLREPKPQHRTSSREKSQ